MPEVDRTLPSLMQSLHQMEFDYAGGKGIDFEPYDSFLSATDTQAWFHNWTGNAKADGAAYRVFGQDGSGGCVAMWTVRKEQPLLTQPVVFFGSEGELGVIAQNFSDYLWLLASGHGPYEAVAYLDTERARHPQFTNFARANATTQWSKPADILARARHEFPEFETSMRALCK